jgi:hypothetical protein
MSLPEYSQVERRVVPFLMTYFYVLIPVWGVLIIGLVVFATPGNRLLAVASAVIGAGPFTLAYIYQEFVQQPLIRVPEPDDVETDVYYDKKLLFENQTVYPLVEVVAGVENRGNETAEDCRVRVQLTSDGFRHEFNSRWMGEQYEQAIDVHPNRVRDVLLLVLVPTGDAIDELATTLADTEFSLDRDEFPTLTNTREVSTISTQYGEFEAFRPMNIGFADSMYPEYSGPYSEEDSFTRIGEHRFIGYQIEGREEYDARLKFYGTHFYDHDEAGTIAVFDEATAFSWAYENDDYDDVRDRIDTCLFATDD